jgi:transaldolase
MTNPLLQLQKLGQSVWYDNIDRGQLVSGQFKRLLDEDGVLGVTANPTIFEKSISQGHAYDEQISQLMSAPMAKMDMSALRFHLTLRTTHRAQLKRLHASGKWSIVLT